MAQDVIRYSVPNQPDQRVSAAFPLPVTTGTGTGSQQVQGTSASGATDDGSNPIKIAAVYSNPLPTYLTGQRGAVVMSAQGALGISASDGTRLSTLNVASFVPTGGSGSLSVGLVSVFNTTQPTYTNGQFGMTQMTSKGSLASSITPSPDAGTAIVPNATAAVASALIAKASAGNLYSWSVTSGASAGYIMIFDSVTAPADGAVTPKDVQVIAANSTFRAAYDIPQRFTTGITIVFSTTGPFTKTASATAFIQAGSV